MNEKKDNRKSMYDFIGIMELYGIDSVKEYLELEYRLADYDYYKLIDLLSVCTKKLLEIDNFKGINKKYYKLYNTMVHKIHDII